MKSVSKFLGVFVLMLTLVLCLPNNVIAEDTGTTSSTTEMTAEFKSYLNENLEYEINASQPKDEWDFVIKLAISIYQKNLDLTKVNFELPADIPENLDKIIFIVYHTSEEEETYEEKHEVTIKYLYDEKAEEKLNELLTSTIQETFNLSDLDMINYYYNRSKMYEYYEDSPVLNLVSGEAKSILDNRNVLFKMILNEMDEMNGLKGPIFQGIGYFTYNDVVYSSYADLENFLLLLNLNVNHIFYVPSDTENTPEAIQAAAQKRINDYLNNENVTITYKQKASEYFTSNQNENFSEAFNNEYKLEGINENDFVYHVVMNFFESDKLEFDMIIKRDTEKMVNPTLKTVDLLTGIEVSTNSIMQLDTIISVKELNSGTEYEKIIKLLNLTGSVSYDINLYSEILEKNITKLDNGTFEVKIPIPEKLAGKDLVVYYVDENGKIETYEVTIKDGYAIFITNHFSIYTLGYKINNTPEIITPIDNENKTEEVPKTYDNIGISILLSTLSLVGISSTVTYLKKRY